jgi:hypothetical protein
MVKCRATRSAETPNAYRKPIAGMGAPPMLRYGYAAKKFWFSFANLTLLSAWLCSAVCVIVGNADPKPLQSPPTDDGNATAAASLSVATALSCWKAVIEPVWLIIGIPQDMGTSEACAGSKDSPITRPTSIVMTNVLLNELPSSIYDDIEDRR